MAMRYTHAMEDAKRKAVEAIAKSSMTDTKPEIEATKRRQVGAIQKSRDHSVTNEKPVADQIAVSG